MLESSCLLHNEDNDEDKHGVMLAVNTFGLPLSWTNLKQSLPSVFVCFGEYVYDWTWFHHFKWPLYEVVIFKDGLTWPRALDTNQPWTPTNTQIHALAHRIWSHIISHAIHSHTHYNAARSQEWEREIDYLTLRLWACIVPAARLNGRTTWNMSG